MIKTSIILLVYIGCYSVLTLNIELSRLEDNLLYSYLKNKTNLKEFYGKLIESNGVDNPAHVYQKITDQDIKQGTIENKVKVYRKQIDNIFYLLVFSINR